MDDDNLPVRKKTHVIGEDLSDFSIGELRERVVALQFEIQRLEQEIAAKTDSRSVADSAFKI